MTKRARLGLRLGLMGGAAAGVLLATSAMAQAVVPAASAAAAVQNRQAPLAPLPDVDVPYTRFVLNNGLTLIVH